MSVSCPLGSFAFTKRWKILSCSRFCCCCWDWCFHNCCFLMIVVFWWLLFFVIDVLSKSWLAIKVSVSCPLCSFAFTKRWEILSCSRFCCRCCDWCFHNFMFYNWLILFCLYKDVLICRWLKIAFSQLLVLSSKLWIFVSKSIITYWIFYILPIGLFYFY